MCLVSMVTCFELGKRGYATRAEGPLPECNQLGFAPAGNCGRPFGLSVREVCSKIIQADRRQRAPCVVRGRRIGVAGERPVAGSPLDLFRNRMGLLSARCRPLG